MVMDMLTIAAFLVLVLYKSLLYISPMIGGGITA
jgi:hypothetical protein